MESGVLVVQRPKNVVEGPINQAVAGQVHDTGPSPAKKRVSWVVYL